MSAPSTSGLSVALLLRVIDVKYGYFTLLYFCLPQQSTSFNKIERTVKQLFKPFARDLSDTNHRRGPEKFSGFLINSSQNLNSLKFLRMNNKPGDKEGPLPTKHAVHWDCGGLKHTG